MSKAMAKVGPPGIGKEGKVWDFKVCRGIVQCIVSYGSQKIISLQFQYVDEDGKLLMSDVFGNPEFVGNKFSAIKLNYPDEYISIVNGWCSDSGVEQLTISTNKVAYSFNKASDSESEDKQYFTYYLGEECNQFGGFYGTCDSEGINSIGVYFKPTMELKAPVATMTASSEPHDSASTQPLIASNDQH